MKQEDILIKFAKIYSVSIPIYKEAIDLIDYSNSAKRFKSELYKALKWLLKHNGTLIPPKASKNAWAS